MKENQTGGSRYSKPPGFDARFRPLRARLVGEAAGEPAEAR